MLVEAMRSTAENWAQEIVHQYDIGDDAASQTLREHITETIVIAIMLKLEPDEWVDRVNRALGFIEHTNRWTEGPRVLEFDGSTGGVRMDDRHHLRR
ncbi:MAG TPA: hypothetical protein VEA41_07460 [Salinarimonas sp.]|jgi:hypothetical protein|nr:hypothetical protein [Salinarimonas sp.]